MNTFSAGYFLIYEIETIERHTEMEAFKKNCSREQFVVNEITALTFVFLFNDLRVNKDDKCKCKFYLRSFND